MIRQTEQAQQGWNAQNEEVVHAAERSLRCTVLVTLSYFAKLVEPALKFWTIEHFETPAAEDSVLFDDLEE
jgi:hypothetical protein